MKNVDLVILAGGKGSRIKKYLKNKPKPMLKFNNLHFLQYLLNIFSKYSFNKIYILAGYKSKIIFKKFHNKNINFIKIECIKEKKLMGTGGSLSNLKRKKLNDFVLINGDTIFDIDIVNLIKSYKKNKIGAFALTQNKKNINNLKLNNLKIDRNKIKYDSAGKLMNGGVYFFKKSILNLIPSKNCSLENDILSKIIKKNKIGAKVYNDFFIDIGTPKYLKQTSKHLKIKYEKPAAFLDRDGVLNYNYGYVHNIKKFKFKKGVLKGLKFLIKNNYYIFIVTNQAGIAKNIFKENDFIKLHIELKKKLQTNNIFFDDVRYCPYHPDAKNKIYKKKSMFRKPGNLMIKDLQKNWLIKMNKSFMIGDQITDELCAKKSKIFFEYAKQDFFKQIKLIIKKINNY